VWALVAMKTIIIKRRMLSLGDCGVWKQNRAEEPSVGPPCHP